MTSWPRPAARPHDLPSEAPQVDEQLIDTTGAGDGRQLTGRALWAARHWLAAGSFGAVVLSAMNVLVPLALGRAVQDGLVAWRPRSLIGWVIVIAVAGIVRAWATTFRLHANTGAALVEHDLRLQTIERTLNPAGMAGPQRSPGELLTIAVSDARTVSRAMIAVTSVPGNLMTLLGCLIAFWFMDWRLVLAVLVLIPPLIWLTIKGVTPIKSRTRAERRAEARAAGVAADLTAGLRVIQGLSATGRAAERFRQVSQQGVRATVATRRVRGAYTGAVNAGVGLFSACLTILGALLALQRTISPGDLVTVVALAQTITPPLRALGVDTATMLSAAHASGDRVGELLDAPPERQAGALNTAPIAPTGPAQIELTGLRTTALETPLNLTIPAGKILGIVAPTPIATDLAAVFNRSLVPLDGALLVDDVPAGDWTPEAYRVRLLTAPEDPTLFDGTARENLDLGQGLLDDELIAEILDASASRSVVEALPEGLDTVVGEGGRRLSGGQRQRLALARALVHAQDALVLVNPTTSVDAVTEARIAEGLRRARAGRTTVIVTASPNLLASADEVVWLGARGEIVARGPHATLLGMPGYREVLA